MSLRAVLLDYGHTLVDYARPEAELAAAYHRINARLEQELEVEVPAAADLLRALSLELDDVVAASYASGSEQEVDFGAIYDEALEKLGLRLSPDLRRWAMLEEQRAWIAGLRCSPHAGPVLEDLKARGLRLAIVSNASYPADAMRSHLDGIGLRGYFDVTVYSSEVGWRKPNPVIYEKALRALEVEPGAALFVGDRLREDIRGPRAVGMRAALTHEFRQEEPAPEDGALAVLRDLAELPACVA